jgi:hypothetical protein
VKQKKVTRGLAHLTKSFISKWILKDKSRKVNMFENLDTLLFKYFPSIYKNNRIEALGGIGKIIFMHRFEIETKN